MYGAGIAYEISPSFDIRAEYRGFVTKVPTFGYSQFDTNKWYNITFRPSAWRTTSKQGKESGGIEAGWAMAHPFATVRAFLVAA